VVLIGGVPVVGLEEELYYSSGYTPRGFTSSPRREAKSRFSGFITTKNKKNIFKRVLRDFW